MSIISSCLRCAPHSTSVACRGKCWAIWMRASTICIIGGQPRDKLVFWASKTTLVSIDGRWRDGRLGWRDRNLKSDP